MDKTIGFIGFGKMGQAILSGIIKSGLAIPRQVKVSASTDETVAIAKETFGIVGTKNNREIAEFADVLFLAVKPGLYNKVITEIKDDIRTDAIIVMIAAGVSLGDVEARFGRKVKAVRTMPNTPSLVGEGMTALCPNESVTADDLEAIINILGSVGKTEIISEHLMDAIPAISGSSPAYAFMFIEALADGGVRQGIPREQAYRLAAQAVLGAAKMVLETGRHPGSLKDDVCTPGGATIEAVAELENSRFRGAILSAMNSCTKKIKGLAAGK
ncbi:pyrroline-5-carboxylate reductase [Peribacillus saganii]|uniref:Pyrroline-5-carboxylate reductase n=1 Tax=Peribacillus saganii TaxID=2303992 RepID=A0A372LV28_9BACI|nr:pyrroline-5-carboxylate reductase [Peribacillus saganii]RFU71424.1 pyrroline-5-carboxylate reductase [Peribacillus saganii]